jgi:thioredoxin 1
MSNAMELTSANFATTIAKGVTLVDFWAEWCNPCRMMGPVIDEIASDYAGRVTVAKVDVQTEQALAEQYDIQSIPALLLFKDGKEVTRLIGAKPKGILTKTLDAALAQ